MRVSRRGLACPVQQAVALDFQYPVTIGEEIRQERCWYSLFLFPLGLES